MKRRRVSLRALLGYFIFPLILQGCSSEVKPAVTAGVDACSLCNMVIDRTNQACGHVLAGKFVPFDSPGCLLRSYEMRRKSGQQLPDAIYFADYHSGIFHRADLTQFLLTDHVSTVMNARVICFGDVEEARASVRHDDEAIVDWNGYQLVRGTPDRECAIYIGIEGMRPGTVETDKGELVELKLRGEGLREDVVLVLKGYDEVGEIRVPASGDPVNLRFWARRPGAGFPLINAASNEPMGMIKVAGAHTMDEELP